MDTRLPLAPGVRRAWLETALDFHDGPCPRRPFPALLARLFRPSLALSQWNQVSGVLRLPYRHGVRLASERDVDLPCP